MCGPRLLRIGKNKYIVQRKSQFHFPSPLRFCWAKKRECRQKKTYKMIHKAEIYNMNYGGSYVLHTHRIFPIQKTIHIYFLSAAVIIYCFGLCRTRGQAKHKILRRVWWCWRMSVSAWAMRNKNKNRNAVIMRSIWSSLGCQTDSASEPRPSRANNWAPGIY